MLKQITKVEQQKNNKKRFNIYLNDVYSFSIHEDILVSFSLFKGKEIEDQDLEDVIKEEERNKIWNQSLRYLSYKPRTKKEMTSYLKRKGYELEDIHFIIDKLEKEKLIDDNQYAKLFIKQRLSSNYKGKLYIAYELKNKGIKDEIIERQTEEIDEEIEYNMARKLIEKKLNSYKGKDWNKIKRSLGQYLQRRGFAYEVVIKLLQEYKTRLLQ